MTNNFNNPFIPQGIPQGTPSQGNIQLPQMGTSSQNDAFEIDLTSASNTIPEGTYKVRCIGVEQSYSKQNNPMFTWSFVIVEGDYSGKDLKYFTALTPSSIWKASEVITALGIGSAGQKVKFSAKDVVGKECYASIEDSDYGGQKRSNISSVISATQYALAKKANLC